MIFVKATLWASRDLRQPAQLISDTWQKNQNRLSTRQVATILRPANWKQSNHQQRSIFILTLLYDKVTKSNTDEWMLWWLRHRYNAPNIWFSRQIPITILVSLFHFLKNLFLCKYATEWVVHTIVVRVSYALINICIPNFSYLLSIQLNSTPIYLELD